VKLDRQAREGEGPLSESERDELKRLGKETPSWRWSVMCSNARLARAVRAEAGPQIGFLRADAQRLPLRDETVDAVVSIAVLQLVPDPAAALAEMARVLRAGGRLAVMVPTAGWAARFWRMLPNIGALLFGDDEIGDILEDHGFTSVRTKNFGPLQWVRAKRG
jgi:arsenite methyltransferase